MANIDVRCAQKTAATLAQGKLRKLREAGLPVTSEVIAEAMRQGWAEARKSAECHVAPDAAARALRALKEI